MALGYAAIITTLFLWSGFFLSLRGGAISALQPADIAFNSLFHSGVGVTSFRPQIHG